MVLYLPLWCILFFTCFRTIQLPTRLVLLSKLGVLKGFGTCSSLYFATSKSSSSKTIRLKPASFCLVLGANSLSPLTKHLHFVTTGKQSPRTRASKPSPVLAQTVFKGHCAIKLDTEVFVGVNIVLCLSWSIENTGTNSPFTLYP